MQWTNFMKYMQLSYKNMRMMGWREGQALFNTLYDIRPSLADRTRATDIDPFFKDSNIAAFLQFVIERWENEKP